MLQEKLPRYIAFALIAFWPAGIMYAARIGNDTAFYVLYAIGFYFLIRWYVTETASDLYCASGAVLLGILAKSNGLILLGTLTAGMILKIVHGAKTARQYSFLIVALLLLSIIMLTFRLRLTEIAAAFHAPQTLLVANTASGLQNDLKLANTIQTYTSFDAATFVVVPFLNPIDDVSGRQFYWNYLLKSSLFGEMQFSGNEHLAIVISLFFLLFCGCIFCVMLAAPMPGNPMARLLWSAVGIGVAASLLLRASIPFSPSNDFRYIFPIIIPFSVLIAQRIAYVIHLRYYQISFATVCVIGVFLLLSVIFFSTAL